VIDRSYLRTANLIPSRKASIYFLYTDHYGRDGPLVGRPNRRCARGDRQHLSWWKSRPTDAFVTGAKQSTRRALPERPSEAGRTGKDRDRVRGKDAERPRHPEPAARRGERDGPRSERPNRGATEEASSALTPRRPGSRGARRHGVRDRDVPRSWRRGAPCAALGSGTHARTPHHEQRDSRCRLPRWVKRTDWCRVAVRR
jgi:hypothetical protein